MLATAVGRTHLRLRWRFHWLPMYMCHGR